MNCLVFLPTCTNSPNIFRRDSCFAPPPSPHHYQTLCICFFLKFPTPHSFWKERCFPLLFFFFVVVVDVWNSSSSRGIRWRRHHIRRKNLPRPPFSPTNFALFWKDGDEKVVVWEVVQETALISVVMRCTYLFTIARSVFQFILDWYQLRLHLNGKKWDRVGSNTITAQTTTSWQ